MIIPLAGIAFPASTEDFRSSVATGAQQLGVNVASLVAEGVWPALQQLTADFSGTKVDDFTSLPKLGATGGQSVTADQFTLRAEPLLVRGLPVHLHMDASAATLQERSLDGRGSALTLQSARDGTITLAAAIPEVERLAQTLLSEQVRPHGAEIVETRLRFTPRGENGVSFQADVIAKVMIMKAPISVSGDLDLSDDLQLRISKLGLTGSGMAATLARGFLQPQFAKVEEKPISLAAFALGDLRLRSARLTVEGERLTVHGTFGSPEQTPTT